MNAMSATILTNLAICVVVVLAIWMTYNPLALAGLMLLRAIPMDDDLADAIAAQGSDEDHQVREVGFNAKYEPED